MSARRSVAALVAFTASAITASCHDESTASSPTDRDSVAASTVEIAVRGCGPRERSGNGTVVEGDLVVTAAHVVAGAISIEVTSGSDSGFSTSGTVVFFDPDLDVAAISTAAPVGEAAALDDDDVAAGTVGRLGLVRDGTVEVVEVEVVRHVTIATTDIYRDAEVSRPGFEVQAPIEPGDSGAMVHADDGGIGIVWARSTERADRAWAVDLPSAVTDPIERAALVDEVSTGPCVDD